jgi:ADP-ribose pyrophosphatase YjhB (NUDIX family)
MNMPSWIFELQAIAQNGLTYCRDEFDKERYSRLMAIASEMAAKNSSVDQHKISQLFFLENGYATPKIDVRAFICKENQLLLVRERSDNLWTLPGGWAEVNHSPSESVIKEVKEEAGYDVTVIRLLALCDKLKHDHPPQWPHAYKCFFHCKIESGSPQINNEICEIKFFSFDEIPELSTHRVTKNQLLLLKNIVDNHLETAFD